MNTGGAGVVFLLNTFLIFAQSKFEDRREAVDTTLVRATMPDLAIRRANNVQTIRDFQRRFTQRRTDRRGTERASFEN